MKYWSKSSLSIYKYLSTMSDTIDKIVNNSSKESNSTMLQKYQTTYYQASKILEYIDRKRKMVNLKVIVEDVIGRLKKDDRRLITLVYFDGVKSEEVAELMGISLRTFFRKKANALKEFTLILQALGYDEEFFEKEYFCEKWFMAVYDNCVFKNCEAEEELDRLLVKRMFNEMSKLKINYNTYLS